MTPKSWFAVVVLAVSLVGGTSRGDRASIQAKAHFEAGTKHYDLSEFAEAVFRHRIATKERVTARRRVADRLDGR